MATCRRHHLCTALHLPTLFHSCVLASLRLWPGTGWHPRWHPRWRRHPPTCWCRCILLGVLGSPLVRLPSLLRSWPGPPELLIHGLMAHQVSPFLPQPQRVHDTAAYVYILLFEKSRLGGRPALPNRVLRRWI